MLSSYLRMGLPKPVSPAGFVLDYCPSHDVDSRGWRADGRQEVQKDPNCKSGSDQEAPIWLIGNHCLSFGARDELNEASLLVPTVHGSSPYRIPQLRPSSPTQTSKWPENL